MSHKKRSAACPLSISFLPHIRQTYEIFAMPAPQTRSSARAAAAMSGAPALTVSDCFFAALAFRWLTDV